MSNKGAQSFNHNLKNPPNEVDEQTQQQHWRTSAPCPFPKPTTQLLKLMMQSVILTCSYWCLVMGLRVNATRAQIMRKCTCRLWSPVQFIQSNRKWWQLHRTVWNGKHTHTPLWQFGTNMRRFCRYETRMLVINPESGAPHSGLECVGTTRNPPSGEANMFRSNMIHHVPMLLGSSPIY